MPSTRAPARPQGPGLRGGGDASRRDALLREARSRATAPQFLATLARRVAQQTTSQENPSSPALWSYLRDDIGAMLAAMGFSFEVVPNPLPGAGPLLIAERSEDSALPTVLTYGHADVIRGQDAQWRAGLSPWTLHREGNRLYGRGTADNKGQHSINLEALRMVLGARGRLGFNMRLIMESGEETGSPGLEAFCRAWSERLQADVFIASDGPRLRPEQATVFGGSRGVLNFELRVKARDAPHHSGNWGGLISNPGIRLAHALATLSDPNGAIRVPEWRPNSLSPSVRAALAGLEVEGGDDAPVVDRNWGEPGLTPAEKVFGWNSFEVLAFRTGNPEAPVNAIPPSAHAHLQLRYVVGTEAHNIVPALQRHLGAAGFGDVEVLAHDRSGMQATRLDPDHPWCVRVLNSIQRSLGRRPAFLPNLGGSLPNAVFSQVLGLPTVWIPHSYAGCQQHAPNEHLRVDLMEEGLAIMVGLFWDLGQAGELSAA
ncbi:MAG: M20 family metallopeptidase [Betaproteobacteria bacterium]